MTNINQIIVDFIDSGRSFAVALVLQAEGSTPRKAAVRAVIDETGRIQGTIGGGAVEAEAQRRAVEACRSGRPDIFEMVLHGADRTAGEPICGGMMRILLDPTAVKDRASYAQVTEAVRQRQRGVLLTTVRAGKPTEVTTRWFSQESIPSDAPFPGADKIRSCMARETPQLFVEPSRGASPSLQVLVEPVIPKPLLVIAGGGHIGQALALQASLVGFDITLVDDRAEFTDPALYPEAVTTCCDDIARKVADLSAGNDTYVVVVTRGHKLDAEALEACIHTPVAYIGMIGSRRKVALIRENFVGTGLATEEEFDRVFTPIGLDIGAVTVPEIAASIVAELIAVRRKGISHTPSTIAGKP
ncbi:MAG: XdhC family protein [Phycisphaerales bacterium]|nr:MAG: XdhC family protein [Phycisphaerales bacterium]